jgi:hypothetical protein
MTKRTRQKIDEARMALEALREEVTVAEPAQRLPKPFNISA